MSKSVADEILRLSKCGAPANEIARYLGVDESFVTLVLEQKETEEAEQNGR